MPSDHPGFRLSPQQERLWSLAGGRPDAPYRTVCRVLLDGPVALCALDAAWNEVRARSEILRTVFRPVPGLSLPEQVILGPAQGGGGDLRVLDLRRLGDGARRRALDALWDALESEPVDPSEEPPVRATLALLEARRSALSLSLHGLCSDGEGVDVVLADLGRVYEGLRAGGRAPDDGEPVQYADVAEALHQLLEGDETQEGRDFWRGLRYSAPGPGELPFEAQAPIGADGEFRPGWVSARLEPQALANAERLGARLAPGEEVDPGGRLEAVLLACWGLTLLRLAPGADGSPGRSLTLGVEFSGRHYEGFDRAAGPFSRVLPVSVKGGDDLRFDEVLGDLFEELGELFDWQDFFSWEDWHGRPEAEEPYFAACFDYSDVAAPARAGDVELCIDRRRGCRERFRLRLSCRRRGPDLEAALWFDRRRWSRSSARMLLACFQTLLGEAVDDHRVRVHRLPVVPPAERHRLLRELSGPARPLPSAPVHELFFHRARQSPDATALATRGEAWTYRELASRSRALARRLRALGVGPDVPVGLLAERSPTLVAGVLGVLAAGGAYLPLDPDYPRRRIAAMLEDARPPVVLVGSGLRGRLPDLPPGTRVLDPASTASEASPRVREPAGHLPGLAGPEQAAYVLFTSGSTGRPKGIVVPHGALANHMRWFQEEYPIGPGDRILQKTSTSFDASVWELFAPLLAQAELVLAEPGVHREPARLLAAVDAHRITVLQVVPSLLWSLVDTDGFAACTSLRRVFSGGEALVGELADRFHRLLDADLINVYGPSETTVQVVSWVAGRGGPGSPEEPVPIGRPIHNTCAHVLDARLHPVPPGIPGQLWIAGAPVSRGFLRGPALTAESFVPDRFGVAPGARMYGSGDLVDRRDDGALVFLGRIGEQNKVRGVRFEPGEIETLLRLQPGVAQAAVRVMPGTRGDERLVAYVVLDDEAEPSGGGLAAHFRSRLDDHLPEPLVPTEFVVLDSLPRSPTGKLDRRALPEPPDPGHSGEGAVLPRSAIEEAVAEIWAELLDVEGVSAHDNFFELGGHSLLGVRLVSRIRKTLGVELSLRSVFESPTVAGVARLVEAAWNVPSGPPLDPVQRDGPLPLSQAQQRLWFLDRLAPGNPYYNIGSAFRLIGPVDERALARSFQELVVRHEALRTTFRTADGEPVQVIHSRCPVPLPVVDLAGLPEDRRSPVLRRLALAEARRPFDLERGPLLRLGLIRLGGEGSAAERVLVLTMHHIVSDAWSVGVLRRELSALYAWFASGDEPPGPPSPIQYADYAVWQRRWLDSGVRERELAYWAERLAELPSLDLPTDRPRPPVQSFRGASRAVSVPEPLAEDLRKLARSRDATLFMVVLAALTVLLARRADAEEVVLGSPIANRQREEIEDLIGFFVNTLVLRVDLSGEPTFGELIERVRDVALGAYAHQSLPFETLVAELDPDRDLGRQPLFQVMFQLQHVPRTDAGLPGVKIEELALDLETAPFDLGLDLLDGASGLVGMVRYSTDLFEATTAERMVRHFRALLDASVAEPGRAVKELSLLDAAERHQLLSEWNDTGAGIDLERPVHRLFEDRAALAPDAVALVAGEARVSYGALLQRARQIGRRLRSAGVTRGVPVVLLVPRSADLVAALLGAWRCGGVVVPLDAGAPRARLETVFADAAEGQPAVILLGGDGPVVKPPGTATVLQLEEATGPAEPPPETAAGAEPVGPGDGAYLIYTSGTSGRPKGVLVEHGSLSNLLQASVRRFGWHPGDRTACLAAESFDIFFFEVFNPLVSGGCVVLFDRRPALDVDAVAGRIQELTRVHAVPALMRELVERVRRRFPDRARQPVPRTLFVGGDAVPGDLLDDLLRSFPASDVEVLYGPTETTVICSSYRVPRRGPVLGRPIGRPLDNAQLHVLDPGGRPVPIGVPGELWIGGRPVARGYHGRDDLTRERFVARNGDRWYRTGDRVRRLPDGTLEFRGRFDDQVKVRGVRVEPAEVEAALVRHPAVFEASVTATEGSGGDPVLVACVRCELEAGGLLASEERAELDAEQVERWRSLYDTDVFGAEPEELADPTFNTRGWNSSYTGEPIPEPEMREWVTGTVERILALRPRRVLEIGCGTGLLLFRIAPRCERYVGTDFSRAALDYTRSALERDGAAPRSVELHLAAADDTAGVEPASVDMAILNSVSQYLPSVAYLVRVIEGAVEATADGGSVFVGDVRSLPHWEGFHASVELHRAPAVASRESLFRAVQRRMAEEPELLVDPALFDEIVRRNPRVRGVEIQLRRGEHHNELTRFRYDAVLAVGEAPEAGNGAGGLAWDWEVEELDLEALRGRLERQSPETVVIRGIPNERLVREIEAVASLRTPGAAATAGELRRELGGVSGVDPEELWALERSTPYRVAVTWSSTGGLARMDAILRDRRAETGIDAGTPRPPAAPAGSGPPWERFGNRPGWRWISERVTPRLQSLLAESLPEAMVPASFVLLHRIPRTAHGKLDRRALPSLDPGPVSPGGELVRPEGPEEELLAGIFAGVLGLDRVGALDSFFALGGHSLLATQVVARIRDAFEVEIELKSLFEAPTVRGLASTVRSAVARSSGAGSAATPSTPALRPRPSPGPAPLSFAQQRLWFLDRLEPESVAYVLPSAFRLRGELDLPALARSLGEVVRRHEVLRTFYDERDGEPVQVVEPPRPLAMPVVDLARLGSAERERELLQQGIRVGARPFDLSRAPMVRTAVFRLDGPPARTHGVLVQMHHVASDGWSLGLLVRELNELYRAFRSGRPSPLPELPVQYADYAVWQREWLSGEVLEGQLAYWRQQLGGDLPVLELPTDRDRPAVREGRGLIRPVALPPEPSRRLAALSRTEGATLYVVLLAAFHSLLSRLTHQTDLAVGTPIAGRRHVETEPLIGFFVNTLVMRGDLSGDPPFRTVVRRLKTTALEAYARQDLPFERLVEELQPPRHLAYTPLFQAMFGLQNAPQEPLELPEATVEPLDAVAGGTKFDLSLLLSESPSGLLGALELDAALFDATTGDRFLAHYRALIETVVERPEARLSEIPVLPAGERHQVTVEWGHGPEITQGLGPTLDASVAAQAERTPETVAVVAGHHHVTYRELLRRARVLADELRGAGAGPESRVAIRVERGPEMVVAVLGVLASGAAYVPIDPDYPVERQELMLKDSGAVLLVSGAGGSGVGGLSVEPRQGASESPGSRRLGAAPDPANLAYVIYTSGSTGRPKGVALCHANAIALLEWSLSAFSRRELDAVLATASICFDLSVFEIFTPLVSGGTVVLVQDLLHWPSVPGASRVSFLTTVPSALAELLRLERLPDALRTVTTAGELLRGEVAELAWTSGSLDRLVNLYGPSEDTTYSTGWEVARGFTGEPPIGRPLPGRRADLLDPALRPVPVGTPGEIFLAGRGLARGYLGRARETADRFLPDPYAESPGQRIYRSGDLARWGTDGNLRFLARTDHQVKVRGFRIELGEIEAVLSQHPAVVEAAAVTRPASGGGVRLVAYVVVEGAGGGPGALRRFLREKLPKAMVPSSVVPIEGLPRTPNRKVDRRALAEVGPLPESRSEVSAVRFQPPRGPDEERLAAIFSEVLELDRVGIHDSFFELGGHSLQATRVLARIRRTFGGDPPLRWMFEHPTVAELAPLVAAPEPEGHHEDRPSDAPSAGAQEVR